MQKIVVALLLMCIFCTTHFVLAGSLIVSCGAYVDSHFFDHFGRARPMWTHNIKLHDRLRGTALVSNIALKLMGEDRVRLTCYKPCLADGIYGICETNVASWGHGHIFSDSQKCITEQRQPGLLTRVLKCKTRFYEWLAGKTPAIYDFVDHEPIVCCPTITLPKTSKSAQKCREYAEALPDIRRLHKRNLVGGSIVEPQEFSHMVALGYLNKTSIVFKCSGSLISEQFVLTAAHCLEDREFEEVKYIRLGSINSNSVSNTFLISRISSYHPHPLYIRGKRYHDIALLKLDNPVSFSRYIHPACLYTQKDFPGDILTALAWKTEKSNGKERNMEEESTLMAVDLDIFPERKCKMVFMKQKTLEKGIVDSQFCAGGLKEPKDTCPGSSGGPLIHATNQKNLYYIVGVTSFGKKECGTAGTPGVYTKVSYYIPWIESVVWPDEKLRDEENEINYESPLL